MWRIAVASCLLSAVVSATLTLALVTWLSAFRGTPDVVRAQRFEVIDQDGKLKAYLGGPPYNDALVILDPDGVERIRLFVLAEGTAFIAMYDAGGQVRARAYVNRQGYSEIALLGTDGRPRHQIGLPEYDSVP